VLINIPTASSVPSFRRHELDARAAVRAVGRAINRRPQGDGWPVICRLFGDLDSANKADVTITT